MNINKVLEKARLKLLEIYSETHDTEKDVIKAVLKVKQFDRVMIKPFEFTVSEWAETKVKGYIEQ